MKAFVSVQMTHARFGFDKQNQQVSAVCPISVIAVIHE